MDAQTRTQERYLAAVEALVAKLKRDRYVLAAILGGSVARGEAWERSDVDLFVIRQDGLERETGSCWLVEDGINIWVEILSRNEYKRTIAGALQGSVFHSVYAGSKLLFSQDASIEAWFAEADRMGARDQTYQLLREVAWVPYYLDKAEKWFHVKDDLHYSFLWILYTANYLARVEVLLNGDLPTREAIHQAIAYNPTFFHAVYTDLIDGPKDGGTIGQALMLLDAYLEERAGRLFGPILDYLAAADGARTLSEINAHLRKKTRMGDLFAAYEWLARKGIIEKLAAPIRLTRKSQVTLEEPAYYYDPEIHAREA